MFLLNTKCSYLLLLQWTIEKYINLLKLEQIKYNSDGLYATVMIEIRLDKTITHSLLNLPPQTLL